MSRAPLPVLRALFASGGAPLAFVRKDEQLAERLLRMVRDDVPAIVERSARAAQILTSSANIERLVSQAIAHADESSDARHDERSEPPGRHARTGQTPSATHGDERSARHAPASATHAGEEGRAKDGAPSAIMQGILKELERAAKPGGHSTNGTERSSHGAPTSGMGGMVAPGWSKILVPLHPKAGTRQAPSQGEGAVVIGPIRILSGSEKGGSQGKSAKEQERNASLQRKEQQRAQRDALASVDAMMSLIHRLEHRGSKEYDARAHKREASRTVATEEYTRERRSAAPKASVGEVLARAATSVLQGAASSHTAHAGTGAPANHAEERAAAYTPAMSEPAATVGGFRGLARWAADLSGDAELSSSIARADGERAPMLQQLHVARRSWSLDGDALALSLDSAARNEGIDLDEVAS